MKLKGKLDIHKYTSSCGEGGVKIILIDESSRTQCVEIDISLEAFAQALFGLSHQECMFELWTEVVGKKHENKTEIVPFKCDSYDKKVREKAAKEALKQFEVDGWMAREDDMHNGNKRTENGQRVAFHRYVEVQP